MLWKGEIWAGFTEEVTFGLGFEPQQDFTGFRIREETFQSRSQRKAGGPDQEHLNPAARSGGLGVLRTVGAHTIGMLNSTNKWPPFVDRAPGWRWAFIFSLILPASL